MGKSKKEKKEKDKDKKAHKKSSSKKHKKDRKKHKKEKDEEVISPPLNITLITEDDYFIKSEEFRVWLNLIKKMPFESLNSSEAREMFTKFLQDWNTGKLADMFYSGIPLEVRDACIKTTHKWGINLSVNEKDVLVRETEKVDADTRLIGKSIEGGAVGAGLWKEQAPVTAIGDVVCRPSVSARAPVVASYLTSSGASTDPLQQDDQRDAIRYNSKVQRKRQRDSQNDFLDDVAPKETGKEALLEKRREVGAKLHAAARSAEENRVGPELSEKDIFGGDDDFHSVKMRLERNKSNKQMRQLDRVRELQEKEQERTSSFMKQLGVDLSQGPIKIQPRNNS